MKNWLHKWYPLILILLLGAVFRFLSLKFRGDFTFDEMFSIHFSSLSWPESLKYWVIETNPPLYTLFLRFWLKLFTASEWLIRLPSVIFSLLTILVVYLTGLKYFNKKIGTIAGLLISLSGLHIFLGSEARTYSLMLLLAALSTYFFLNLITKKETNYKLIGCYVLIQTLLVYTHLTAILVPVIQVIIILFSSQAGQRIKRIIFYGNFTTAILFSLWFIPSLINKLSVSSLNGWYFASNNSGHNIFYALSTLFLNTNITSSAMLLFVILISVLLITTALNFKKLVEVERNKQLYIFFLSLVPPLLAVLIGIDGSKYFSISLPAIALLIAYGITHLAPPATSTLLVITVCLLILPSSLGVSTLTFFSWQPVTKYLSEHETKDSLILINPFNEKLIFDKYYQGPTPSKAIYLIADDLSLEERIVRYNWQMLPTIDKFLDNWLQTETANSKQVFLLQYTRNINKLPVPWFLKNGWKLAGQAKTKGLISLYIFEFHAPDYSTTTTD